MIGSIAHRPLNEFCHHDLKMGKLESLCRIGTRKLCLPSVSWPWWSIRLADCLVDSWSSISLDALSNFTALPLSKANRAQEILYGPTLKPYLYGEQIGGALLAKLKSPTLAICTDSEHVLSLRDHTSTPVVLIPPTAAEGSDRCGVC